VIRRTPAALLACIALAACVVLVGCGEHGAPPAKTDALAPASADAQQSLPPAPPNEPPAPKVQLPKGIAPLAYRLDFEVFPEREVFAARARITIRVDAATDGFFLHGRNLTVDSIALRAGSETIAATYRQATPDGVARVTLAHAVEPQTAELDIRYHAHFSRHLEGLFHVQTGGEWYAFTQFEPIDARGAFPGFDEPRFKTPFTLSIVAPKGLTVASNSPIAAIDALPDGTQRVSFEPTPPLPTYLLAFAVGPLDVADGGKLDGASAVPLRGLATKGRGAEFHYALANAGDFVALLEDYFGRPYPFKKLDLVAVPGQPGAMENPGLLTFGEYMMLFGEHPPLPQQRAFANVAAHELAHQWFGDSVTMAWWDDLWLNEAFADFMSAKVVQTWRPSYHADEGLVQSALSAMGADSLANVRRIREPIENFNDINNAFDGITYEKGAGVLNMVEGFVGDAAFRDGVRAHLQRHAGGSADMSDLVGALVEASGRAELVGVMQTFTELPGTPLVDVAVHCGDGPATVTLTQQRYLPVGSTANPRQQWDIPICMRYGVVDGVREQCTVLAQPTAEVALDGVDGCPTWLVPNRGGRGYYRWRLDETRLDRLIAAMYSALTPSERLALADSLSAAVSAGGANLSAYFARVPQLLSGRERYLLSSPMPIWRTLQTFVLDDAGRVASRARMRELYSAVLGELGRRGVTNDEDRLTQITLIAILANDARDATLRAELTRDAVAYVGYGGDGELHPEKLDPNLVNTALRVASQDADGNFALALADRLKATDDPVLRAALLNAIGAANDSALAQRLALDDSIRGDDYLTLLASMFSLDTAERNWPWFSANVDALLDRAPTFERHHLIYLNQNYCSAARADAVAAMFEPRLKRIDGGRRALDQAVEHIRLCVAFRNAYATQASSLFASH
jgi:alanyl aminopeptidase